MPALLIYLLKVNIALLLFCLGYYTVLRRLTFYTLNRVYLILSIIFCSLYPTINFTRVVQNHRQLAKPLQVIIIDLGNRAQNISKPIVQTNYWQWIVILFWFGVGLMTIRLIIQFFSLYNLYRRSKPGLVNQQQVRLMNDNSNPFSFWQHIYINPELHSETELSSIIAHEQVHVKQWHTLDVLLAELSLIFYWFNPGVWMMKKAISENLEFITDRKILQQGADAKSYQYSLLYTCVNSSSNTIVNHFNISTIKNRIMMMNSKKSAVYKVTHYTFILPAVLVLLLAFSTSKAALIKSTVSAAAKTVSQHVITIANMASSSVSPSGPTDTGKSQVILRANIEQIDNVSAIQNADTAKHETTTRKLYVKLNKAILNDSTYYLIDGVRSTGNQFKSLNPADIAKIEIFSLPASELFGEEAKKGAVIVTTKNNVNPDLTNNIQYKINSYRVGRNDPIDGYIKIVQSDSTGSIKGKLTEFGESAYVVAGRYLGTFTGNKNGVISASDAPDKITIVPKPGNFKPLYVIDGIPNEKPIPPTLNADDVLTISILKDSVATAIYGDKGKNGVILITTKYNKKATK